MYVFDFDGTLCRSGKPYVPIVTIYQALLFLDQDVEIWTASKRMPEEIYKWLDEYNLKHPRGIRVPYTDARTSVELKESWALEPGQNIDLVFDDLFTVCKALQRLDIPVIHVL